MLITTKLKLGLMARIIMIALASKKTRLVAACLFLFAFTPLALAACPTADCNDNGIDDGSELTVGVEYLEEPFCRTCKQMPIKLYETQVATSDVTIGITARCDNFNDDETLEFFFGDSLKGTFTEIRTAVFPEEDSVLFTISQEEWNLARNADFGSIALNVVCATGTTGKLNIRYRVSYLANNDCDGDCILNECEIENCNKNSLSDDCELDTDGDNIIDSCDACEGVDDTNAADSDGDGIPDSCDICPGLDDNFNDCNQNGICDTEEDNVCAADLSIDVTGVPGSGTTSWSFAGEHDILYNPDNGVMRLFHRPVPLLGELFPVSPDEMSVKFQNPVGFARFGGFVPVWVLNFVYGEGELVIRSDLRTKEGCTLENLACPGTLPVAEDKTFLVKKDINEFASMGTRINEGVRITVTACTDTEDSDSDGMPDSCDLCPGFDDFLDCNRNDVPDGCELMEPFSMKIGHPMNPNGFINAPLEFAVACNESITRYNVPPALGDVEVSLAATAQGVESASAHFQLKVNDSLVGTLFNNENEFACTDQETLIIPRSVWNAALALDPNQTVVRLLNSDSTCNSAGSGCSDPTFDLTIDYEADGDVNANGIPDNCALDCIPGSIDSDGDGVGDGCDQCPGSMVAGVEVDAFGCAMATAWLDSDFDGDVDDGDINHFFLCDSGSGLTTECARFDNDSDGDLDILDFFAIQDSVSGSGALAEVPSAGGKIPRYAAFNAGRRITQHAAFGLANEIFGNGLAVSDPSLEIAQQQALIDEMSFSAGLLEEGVDSWIGGRYIWGPRQWVWQHAIDPLTESELFATSVNITEFGSDPTIGTNWYQDDVGQPIDENRDTFGLFISSAFDYKWRNTIEFIETGPIWNIRGLVAQLPILCKLGSGCEEEGGNTSLNVQVTSNGSTTVSVLKGTKLNYEIIAQLGNNNNEGLAGFAFNLAFDGGDLIAANNPVAASLMAGFDSPSGYTNPNGFGGTISDGNLIQVGGAQNTIKHTGSAPSGSVITGVAKTSQVLVSGSLTVPTIAGTYSLTLSNLNGTVINPGQTGSPVWRVEPAIAGSISPLTIIVSDCASDLNGDGNCDELSATDWEIAKNSIGNGELCGIPVSISPVFNAQVIGDAIRSDFGQPSLSATQALQGYTAPTDWVTSFEEPISNLLLYAFNWHAEVSKTVSYTFNQPVEIASGFANATVSGNTLSLPTGDYTDTGILKFSGPLTSLTLISDHSPTSEGQALTFVVPDIDGACSNVVIPNPAITVDKSSTISSLDAPFSVPYSYLVTNTGNVAITGLSLDDDNDDAGSLSCPTTSLAVDESTTCTATRTFIQSELDAGGSLDNTVTAITMEGATASDSLSIPIVQTAIITVVKTSTTSSLDAPSLVNYSYLVTNTGNVAISGLVLSDDNDDAGSMACLITTLAAGTSTICTATRTFTQNELNAGGSLNNNVTANTTEGATASDSLSIPIVQTAAITVDKTSSTSSLNTPSLVTYSYLVTNTGNVAITGLSLDDDNDDAGSMSCPTTSLAVGATTTCTATRNFIQSELDAGGSLDNNVTANTAEGATASDSWSINIVTNPAISVDKTSSTSSLDAPGSVPYNYLVTNTGNVTITGLALTDDNASSVSCTTTTLAVGAKTNCTATRTFTQSELNTGGTLDNVVTANTTEGATATDSLSIAIVQNPAITVDKTSSTSSLDAPESVSYSYLVTNTGNVAITGLSLDDNNDDAGSMSCTATTIGVGANTNCTATRTFTQSELNVGGSLDNNVTASTAEGASASDSLSIAIVQNPAISVDKTSNTSSLDAPGSVSYSYLVTNTGNVAITGLSLDDNNDDAGSMRCTATTIAVGASTNCTATRTFTQSELNAGGTLDNIVSANTAQGASASDSLSIVIVQNPAITVDKTSTTSSLDAPSSVSYSYLVTNTGNVAITELSLEDDNDAAGSMSCTATTIAVGASTNCTATRTFTQSELNVGGSLDNNVTASTAEGASASDSLSIAIVQNPAITVDKTSSTSSLNAPSLVSYNYLVTNTGNVAITGLSLEDDNDDVGSMNCTATTIAVGASTHCTATRTFTQSELNSGGSLDNVVTANSTEGATATDSLSIAIVQNPAITVDKSSTSSSLDSPSSVSYNYLVTNTGNVTITGLALIDDNASSVSCATTTLAVGENINCSATRNFIQSELDAGGSLDNNVTVNTTEGATASDSLSINIVTNPAITVAKSSTSSSLDSPSSVSYNYLVTNTGNVTITGLALTDDNASSVTCATTTTLAVGANTNCTATYTFTQSELNIGGTLDNIVSVNTTEGATATDSLSITIVQNPAINMSKTANVSAYRRVNDEIIYNLAVENTGNVAFPSVEVTDLLPGLPTVDCGNNSNIIANLEPKDLVDCTATYIITQANLDQGFVNNTAIALSTMQFDTTDSDSLLIGSENQAGIKIRTLTAQWTEERTVLSGEINMTDETNGGKQADGFLIVLTDNAVDWEYSFGKKNPWLASDTEGAESGRFDTTGDGSFDTHYQCNYEILNIDGDTSKADTLAVGDTVTFDESLQLAYSCTFDEEIPLDGQLRGSVIANIFNGNGREAKLREVFKLGGRGL